MGTLRTRNSKTKEPLNPNERTCALEQTKGPLLTSGSSKPTGSGASATA